jgi:hypothetical protein
MFPFRPAFGSNVVSEEAVPGFRVNPSDVRPELGFNVVPGQVPGFRVYPSDHTPNADIQPVKDPLRCSGPNSDCSEWSGKKYRSPGTFRDIEIPPFRLCPQCFEKAYKRPGGADDTYLFPPSPFAPGGSNPESDDGQPSIVFSSTT